MLPAIAGLAAVQVNIIVNTAFAASEEGAISWLNYAFRFLQLPIGVFGVAIATVSTTRYADAAADQDRPAMSEHLVEGLRLVSFLTVPSTVGLMLLSKPIIRLIYQHGRFGSHDTLATGDALELYAVGLVAYSAVKVLAPAFYATGKARIAVAASISAVAGNLIINITLHPIYGYRVLALGTAVAALLNFAVLMTFFHRKIHAIDASALLRHFARVLVAAGIMGAAVHYCHEGLSELLAPEPLGARLALVFVPIVAGVLIYAGACWVLRIEELADYVGRFTRRLHKR
jgi:putative peptidoglycan lipid II flippase